MTDILLIDSDSARSQATAAALSAQGFTVQTSPEVTHEQIREPQFDCIVGFDSELKAHLSALSNSAPVILLTVNGTIPDAVAAVRNGAADYLQWPLEPQQLSVAIERASVYSQRARLTALAQFPLIGESEAMQFLKESITKAGPTQSPVLITGPSGTGKELVARAVHASSPRASAPLITINCATVPHNLIEAELFGVEQFQQDGPHKSGLVAAAEGGTLFLDEVAELPVTAQAKLVQVLKGENRPVGSSEIKAVDIRVIAASHRDLKELSASGSFREDLFYRLNVVCLELPPLHERDDDVLAIADFLLERTASRLGKPGLSFDNGAKQAMRLYKWPGNVRELENAIERAVILSDAQSAITQAQLAIDPAPKPSEPEVPAAGELTSLEDYFVKFVQQNQDQLTETELAEKLGISRKSLWERRQRLNIPRKKTRKRGPRQDADTRSSNT